MSPFNKVKEWSEMTLPMRYNFLLGTIVVVLSFVIIHLYVYEIPQIKDDHKNTINSIVDRYTARESAIQARLEVCNENYIRYLENNEKTLRELLFEARKIKQKVIQE